MTIDPIPIPFSCEEEQYIVPTGSLDNGNPSRCPGGLVICVSNNEVRLAMTYLFRKGDHGSKSIPKCAGIQPSNEFNGILYYNGRILPSMMERIRPQMSDSIFDLSRTNICVPITDKHSPLAYAIINEVHNHHPGVNHSGVESALRHVQLNPRVIGGRELVKKKYGKNCTRYRSLNKNVVKVLMGPLHEDQLKIAPAFCRTQVDLFGPFDSYDLTNKRKSNNIWFFIFCCVTTSAIDIRVMEDYSTDAFLLAFIRFACRVGHPKLLMPDEGGQLVKGCKSMILKFVDVRQRIHTE